MSKFKTIAKPTEAANREKASRFLAFAFPVNTIEEIESHLSELRKTYYDSRHVCYAYRLGPTGENARANDAGEPAHSAGTPILNQIRSRELTDVLVVVVRYFGGTKLGIPGLIEAYGGTAGMALDTAEILLVKELIPLKIRFPYTMTAEVRRILHHHSPEKTEESFAEDCRMTLWYEVQKKEDAERLLAELGILVD